MVQIENYLSAKWKLCVKTTSSVPGGYYFLDNMDDQEEYDIPAETTEEVCPLIEADATLKNIIT